MTDNQKFQDIWDEAWKNGEEKAKSCFVQHVVPHDPYSGRKYKPIPICGFAWLRLKPATTKFARWMKNNTTARTSDQGGLIFWINEYGQSHDRKLAHARGMAEVFKNHGFDAWAEGSLD